MSRILAVDDTRALLNMLRACLERGGHEVFTAKDGVEALEALREHRPDLVITDLNMPKMNGLEFITAARADPCGAGIPIVMLTTESAPGMKAKGKSAGATGWINKPFDADQLIAVTRKLLG